MFLRVVTTPFITAMADEARERANVLILLVGAHPADFARLLPASRPISSFSPCRLSCPIAWTPQSPLADSLALSGVRRFGSAYAGMRIWGSISFLCANLGGGIHPVLHGCRRRAR